MTVTRELIVELQRHCAGILERGRAFFAHASNEVEGKFYGSSPREIISPETLAQAELVRAVVRDLTARIIDAAKSSPLIGREDMSDTTTAMKAVLAALRLKGYERWDTQVLHDEDIVLGVRQAGQSEYDTNLRTALRSFEDGMQRLTDAVDLLVPGHPITIVGEDDKFARLAVDEARNSTAEDGRVHPLVGAVVVKDGRVIATAHRGEVEGNHAEYIALEKKLENTSITGCTVYTTLEPCTTRKHPKIPCAERLVDRKVARVVIGMLDPNPDIRGRGMWRLQEANIAVEMFPHDLTREIQELNRKFIRSCLESDVADTTPQDRQLTLDQENYLKESIQDFAGQAATVRFVLGDAESQTYAQQIAQVLVTAGWHVKEVVGMTLMFRGIRLSPQDPTDVPQAAESLIRAFSEQNVSVARDYVQPTSLVYNGNRYVPTLYLFVGKNGTPTPIPAKYPQPLVITNGPNLSDDLGQLSKAELAGLAGLTALALRDYEIRNRRLFEAEWHIHETTMGENSYRGFFERVLRPKARALRDELERRLAIGATTVWAIDAGALDGPQPLRDAANYLDELTQRITTLS